MRPDNPQPFEHQAKARIAFVIKTSPFVVLNNLFRNRSFDLGRIAAKSILPTRPSKSMGGPMSAPKRPTVVIVVDGFDPAYLEHGFANGTLPTMKSFKE